MQECLIRELKHGDIFYGVGANAGCDVLKSHDYCLFDLQGRAPETSRRSGAHVLAVPLKPQKAFLQFSRCT